MDSTSRLNRGNTLANPENINQGVASDFHPSLTRESSPAEMKIVNQIEKATWHDFIDRHPQASIFHTPEMFQVFAAAKGFKPTLWAALQTDGQVAALFLPVQVTLNRLLGPFTTRAISYGSVLSSSTGEGSQALSQLLKAYTRQVKGSCLFTEMRNLADLAALQPLLRERGFLYEDHLNYLINLNRSPDDLFQSFGSRTRKNLRHGLNRGEVTIHEVQDREQIAICYRLIEQTYRSARVPIADQSLFEAAFDLLYPKGMVRFTMAYVSESPVAVSVELLYKDGVYGWYSGLDRAFSNYLPNELLMWDILRWASERGYRSYDFGGAGKPDEKYGVRDFKAKFGGDLVCYGRNTFVHMPWALWLSKQGYSVMRRLFYGRFPGL